MPFFPVPFPPGIVKTDSPYAAAGRWISGDKVRFRKGRAEKVGGASKFIPDQFDGYTRGAQAWTTSDGFYCVVFGTATTLYIIRNGTLADVTPFRVSGITLTNPFTTTNGSPIVTVTDVDHGITTTGTMVEFDGASAVGGLTIDGEYLVTEVVDTDTFKITAGSNASSGATGGGTVTASYHINVGLVDPAYLTGWGVGLWGYGGWGVDVSAAYGILQEPLTWSMDNYGEDLVLCPSEGTIYYYDGGSGLSRPTPITGAPERVRATFVTPERYIFALGCTKIDGSYGSMTVRWPDQLDLTDWSPSDVDTSNERTLQGGARLVAGCGFQQGLSLVWSDSCLFAFQYTGSTLIYDTRKVGDECGLIGSRAFAKTDSAVFWMSLTGFHYYNGGGVANIPNSSDLDAWVFDNINSTHSMKAAAYYNREFNEVWFFYPTGVNTENDSYVAVCLDDFSWTVGTWSRTAAAKFTVGEKRPLLFGADGYVWAHESDPKNEDGAAIEAYIESAPFDLDGGNTGLDVWAIVPDFERQDGDISAYLYGLDHPRDGVVSEDTVTIAEADVISDTRLAGRQIGLRLTSNEVNGDFRLGQFQLEISAGGKKRGSRTT